MAQLQGDATHIVVCIEVRAMGAAPQPHVMPVVELLYCLRQAAEVARGSWFLGAPVSERAKELGALGFLVSWCSLFLGASMRRERKEERSSL